MTATKDSAGQGDEVDPERAALVWMDAQQALIVRWIQSRDEPQVERIVSDVPPRRTAVGSVRRGPARPEGGGHVPGHGTVGRHLEQTDRYMNELVGKLAGLCLIEVRGRGQAYQDLAMILRDRAEQAGVHLDLATEATSRRPSERQLMARLRKMVDRQLPRREMGRYHLTPEGPTSATGRPTPAAAGRRTLRPAALPEHVEIELEVEAMLSDDPSRTRIQSGSRRPALWPKSAAGLRATVRVTAWPSSVSCSPRVARGRSSRPWPWTRSSCDLKQSAAEPRT